MIAFRNRHRTRAGTITAVVLLACMVGGCGQAKRERSLDQLLILPQSPEEHAVIADNYARQAAETRAIAAKHLTLAARYRVWTVGDDAEAASNRERMVVHCEKLARHYDHAAVTFQALAREHATFAGIGAATTGFPATGSSTGTRAGKDERPRLHHDMAGDHAPSSTGGNAFGDSTGQALPSDEGQAYPTIPPNR